MSFRTRFHQFVERHIVGDDPYPEYSRLDRMDGLGRGEVALQGAINDGLSDAHRQEHFGQSLRDIDGGSLNLVDVGPACTTKRVPR